MKQGTRNTLLALLLATNTLPAQAMFDQGDMSLMLILGSGQAFNQNYTIFGAGVGYYVVDGLKLGFEGQVWNGGDVSISKISPDVQYVFTRSRGLQPYIGAYYRHTSIEGFDNLESAGGRAGVYLSKQQGYYLSIGMVYEKYISCDESIYVSCSDSYPEITFAFSL